MFIKDSTGNKSLTATVAVIGFTVVMIKLLTSGSSITLGDSTYTFGTIDAAMIAAVLAPCLGSYTVRRWGNPSPTELPDPDADNGMGPR